MRQHQEDKTQGWYDNSIELTLPPNEGQDPHIGRVIIVCTAWRPRARPTLQRESRSCKNHVNPNFEERKQNSKEKSKKDVPITQSLSGRRVLHRCPSEVHEINEGNVKPHETTELPESCEIPSIQVCNCTQLPSGASARTA